MWHKIQIPKVRDYICNVRDKRTINIAMCCGDYVFSADPLKQVPLCEFLNIETKRTNVDLFTQKTSEATLSTIAQTIKGCIQK